MRAFRLSALCLGLALTVAACQKSDLQDPPAPLGPFALGLNIVVTDKMQKVPISRNATGEEWEAALEQAIEDRFGRYTGDKLYNFGIAIDGYALAPPGIPVIAAPKSILAIKANIWDDAAQKKINTEPRQIIVFESLSGDTVIGTGLTRTRKQQMEALSYNAAKKIEEWLLDNPEWFGLPPKQASGASTPSPKPPQFDMTAPPLPAADAASRPVPRPTPTPAPAPAAG